MSKEYICSFIQDFSECPYKTRNVFGREVCTVFGKMECFQCKYREQPDIWWGYWDKNGKLDFYPNGPIKSSLGFLYGYPSKITHIEPMMATLDLSGTSSVVYPIRKSNINLKVKL